MGYASLVLSEPSLVAYWRMNESQGVVAVDSKGGRNGFYNGNFALNRNGFLYTGPSVFFDGASSFVEMPYDPVFHPGAPTFPGNSPVTYSIEAWVQYILPPGNDTFGFPSGWLAGVAGTILNIKNTGLYEQEWGSFLKQMAANFPTLVNGNWHHVVETYDGTNLSTYLDGLRIENFPFPSLIATEELANYPFVVGGYGSDSNPLGIPLDPIFGPSAPFFHGYISNVAFYDTAISPFRVLAHFNSAFVPDPTPHAVNASNSVVFTPTGDATFRGVRGQAQVTQLVVEGVRGQSDGAAVVTQLVVETVTPFVAGGTGTFPAAATSSAVFTPTASAGRGFTAAGTASVTFTPAGKGFHGLYKQAEATALFSAGAVLTNRAGGGVAAARVVFRARAKNKFLPVVFGDDYLGRFQLGQEVPLWVLVRDQHGVPALPTAEPPVARVYNLDARRFVESVEMVRLRRSRLDSVYARGLPLGRLYAPGRHAVLYRAPSGGFTGYNMATFEVVAGGDPAGPSVASHSFPSPAGDQTIVQLGAGLLAKGSRPRIS